MGLTELPSELFRMKNVKKLYIANNKLCSLPSVIAHLATLEELYVRCRSDLAHLTTGTLFHFRSPTTSSRLFRPSLVS
jgi:hypothetical protein